MARILMLTHRIPFPPDKGDKIRSFNLFRHLAERHEVHLGFFIDDPADAVHVKALREMCASVCAVPLNPKKARILSAKGLLTGRPLSVAYYDSAPLKVWVRDLVRHSRPDLMFGFSSGIAHHLYPYAGDIPLVMDFCDLDSEKWRQYGQESGFPMNLIYAREGRSLLKFERKVAKRAKASLFVTRDEAALFVKRAPEARLTTFAVENGVDLDAFDPETARDDVYGAGGPIAVFTGAMDYRPNIDAVTWFAASVWPLVRAQVTDARFVIAGGKPSPDVMALDGRDGIVVTGRVPDIQPYIAGAQAVVAPLRIARGIQNKVLEGMAMAKPVVTTPEGFEGIDATPGRDLLVHADPQPFADAVIDLLLHGDRTGLGAAARARIVARYGWPAALAPLDRVITATLSKDGGR